MAYNCAEKDQAAYNLRNFVQIIIFQKINYPPLDKPKRFSYCITEVIYSNTVKQKNHIASVTTKSSASTGDVPAVVLSTSVVIVPLTLILSLVLTLSLIIVG